MYRTGHYGAALIAWAPFGYALMAVDPLLAILGGAGVLALARVPDLDHDIPLVSHRGITHTLLFLMAVAGLLGAVGWQLGQGSYRPLGDSTQAATFGVLVGTVSIGSHLLADVLTPAGVPLLWPLSSRTYSVHLARADNTLANFGLLALGVAATAAALVAGAPA